MFDIEDGSSLDVDCTRAYYTETEQLMDRMLTKIDDIITTELCGDDVATTIAKTQTFFGFGNQVSDIYVIDESTKTPIFIHWSANHHYATF